MSKWIPFPAYADSFPIDIRCAFKESGPAGQHGFLKTEGTRFVFEDGTPARFWGTNFNSALCFPSHEYAEQVAERVAAAGLNIVRLHQTDMEVVVPNMFEFTRGALLEKTGEPDSRSLDRFDYLFSCLKNRGIYIYLDVMTYRRFKSGDGVENASGLRAGARFYSYTDPYLIKIQRDFMAFLWSHVNPYTGLAYKDDPAIVFSELLSEDDLFAHRISNDKVEPYYSNFCKMYFDWADERGIKYDKEGFDPDVNTPELIEFKMQVMENYYAETTAFLRELGVKIPLCGTNWTECAAVVKAQKNTSYNEGHCYQEWIPYARFKIDTRPYSEHSLTERDGIMCPQIYGRLADKPYFVSEWDIPWPLDCRAEAPLLFASIGCLQEWGGFMVHTYGYTSRHNEFQPVGMEIASRTIGMGYHRQGQMTTWNDPALFGLFPHAALIMRRGDVSPANGSIAIKLTDMTAKMEDFNTEEYVKALSNVAEYTKAGVEFDDLKSKTAKAHYTIGDKLIPGDGSYVRSDTGELYRNLKAQYGTINTERTQAAYGFIGKQGEIKTDDLTIRSETDFATVAVSSLNDSPIAQSNNILLTAVGRTRNTDERREYGQILDIGRAPILIEVIEAEIEIKNADPRMKVWGITSEGFYTGEIPTSYENGTLKFKIGEKFPSMYYHIRID